MNFDEAIAAHSDWKRKLGSYLQKPDHSLKADDVAANDKCPLGKWIASEGHKHSTMSAFAKLDTEHTRFHKAAADVIRRADKGENTAAEVVLGAHSEFGAASSSVVRAIMEMKQKV
jgi:hypothetical protein